MIDKMTCLTLDLMIVSLLRLLSIVINCAHSVHVEVMMWESLYVAQTIIGSMCETILPIIVYCI